MGRLRPQIMAAVVCGTVFGLYGMWVGMQMGATEEVTAVIGGYSDFLGEFRSRF